jgi:nitronate monooxygenase
MVVKLVWAIIKLRFIMKWTNEITRLLGIDYPIVQAPMFGVTTPKMVAATSNINCLGSLALGDLSAEKCIETIRTTRELTHKPFAVNI